jgi:chemotaxis protein MotB
MRRKISHAEGHENLDRWLLTYADMITLLTAFFLMLYSMSVMSRGKFSALLSSVREGFSGAALSHPADKSARPATSGGESTSSYGQYQKAMSDLRKYVEQQGKSGQVNVRGDERGVTISLLSDGMLFARSSATLQPQSAPLLDRVRQILKAAPNAVQVEGHTDDLPIHTAQFPSNWELSTARAGAILRTFTEGANGLPAKRFTCAGYAAVRPLAANDTETHRGRNRRVDIVLLKTDQEREADLLRRQELHRVLQDAPGNTPSGSKTENSVSGAPDRDAAPQSQTTATPSGGANL